jgi:hypothetical protein
MSWRVEFSGRLVELSPHEDLLTELAMLREDLAALRRQLARTRAQTAELLRTSCRLSDRLRARSQPVDQDHESDLSAGLRRPSAGSAANYATVDEGSP